MDERAPWPQARGHQLSPMSMSGDRPTASTDTPIVPGTNLDAARALGLVLDARLDADEFLDRLRVWAARAEGGYADNTWRAWRAGIRVWCA